MSKVKILVIDDMDARLATYKILCAKQEKLEADLQLKKTELENKFNPLIKEIKDQQSLIESEIEKWATEHKSELSDSRTWNVPNGSFGFRQSESLTAKNNNWDIVIHKIKEAGKKFSDAYLRIKLEVAKTVLKADLNSGKLSEKDAKNIGVSIETKDGFFIK